MPDPRTEMHDAVKTLLGGVHGLEGWRAAIQDGEGGSWTVIVKGQGWSPSLHVLDFEWKVDMATRPANSIPLAGMARHQTLEHRMRDAFGSRLQSQLVRGQAARTLGFTKPLRMVSSADAASSPHLIEMEHVCIDRQILTLKVQAIIDASGECDRPSLDAQLAYDIACPHDRSASAVRTPLTNVYSDAEVIHGLNLIRRLPVSIHGIHATGRFIPLMAPMHALSFGSPVITFDGHCLAVIAGIPETACALAAGRPVSDVISTGSSIDTRTIMSAQSGGAWTTLILKPDCVMIGDLPAGEVTLDDVIEMPTIG